MTHLAAVVLAAGRSRRMRSSLSKVLHCAAGRPLIHPPVETALQLGATQVVVVVNPDNRQAVEEYLHGAFDPEQIRMAVQDPPRGTGDAVTAGLTALDDSTVQRILILAGDVPLVTADSLQELVQPNDHASLTIGTCTLPDPTGYGRILRDSQGRAVGIREQKDLQSPGEAEIREINTGLYCAALDPLRQALATLKPDNAQGEYYLTDIVPYFATAGGAHTATVSRDAILGVNDRIQLHAVEEILRTRIADRHRRAGVTIAADAKIDADVVIGEDVVIEGGVHLRGSTTIGEGCTIDVGCVVTDCTIQAGTVLLPYTVASQSHMGEKCRLGPFTHLRPKSVLEREVHLGNFVETKATKLCAGAKANHLSYLGDGEIGEGSNIGAGTIFCNYDGFSKHFTRIGKNVFVGSDSQLVAPVTVGDGAFVATATCVTEDVPPDAVAIGRSRAINKPGYATRLRSRLAAAKQRAGNQPK